MASLAEIILECINNHLESMDPKSGAMPAGHNGPYLDPETPLRNTCHWLISFAKAYEWTADEKYLKAAGRCANYLVCKEARPHRFSFFHRSGPKDHCNGLIGQAWTFEALANAAHIFNDQHYTDLAEEVFFQHNFDKELGLWDRLEIDGTLLSCDMTFNHQLWFAACASLLKGNKQDELHTMVLHFLHNLDNTLTILPGGLIFHPMIDLWKKKSHFRSVTVALKKFVRSWLTAFKTFERPAVRRQKLLSKSVGYHSFNMYGFALLKKKFPHHPLWSSKKFSSMVDFMTSDYFKEKISTNKYGYPYNPPGFEVPFSCSILKDMGEREQIDLIRYWTGEQFARCYNPQSKMLDRNTDDGVTLTARLYEIMQFPYNILKKVDI
ncbi:MAG: hypothetical protein KQH63_14290 [Desulfobulbaceae bacterium]|nr:hypothetical protein [Desulfobulbaceae bacterium]